MNNTSTNQQPLTLATTSAGNHTTNMPSPENCKIYSDMEAVVNITALPKRTAARGHATKLMIEKGYVAIRTATYKRIEAEKEIHIWQEMERDNNRIAGGLITK